MILRYRGRFLPRFLWRVSTRPRRLDVVRSWWAFWRVYKLLAQRHGKYLDVEPREAAAAWAIRVDECMEPIDTHDGGFRLATYFFGFDWPETFAECLAVNLQVWLEDVDLTAKAARYYDEI
ncbi:MAG: hypothetical protein ACP5J0_06505 [Pyrobaculum sp.]